jgi:hypothetical protein
LFQRFHCEAATSHEYTPLRDSLRGAGAGKPFALVDLGLPSSEQGWTLSGWTMQHDADGPTWRASGDQSGTITRPDFQDQGYRWLIVRLTEGPKGGRKTIAVNGQVIGEFLRTGAPETAGKEWWVVRSYRIPDGLLKNGPLEIRFTDPGIAIDAVALSVDPVADTK